MSSKNSTQGVRQVNCSTTYDMTSWLLVQATQLSIYKFLTCKIPVACTITTDGLRMRDYGQTYQQQVASGQLLLTGWLLQGPCAHSLLQQGCCSWVLSSVRGQMESCLSQMKHSSALCWMSQSLSVHQYCHLHVHCMSQYDAASPTGKPNSPHFWAFV